MKYESDLWVRHDVLRGPGTACPRNPGGGTVGGGGGAAGAAGAGGAVLPLDAVATVGLGDSSLPLLQGYTATTSGLMPSAPHQGQLAPTFLPVAPQVC